MCFRRHRRVDHHPRLCARQRYPDDGHGTHPDVALRPLLLRRSLCEGLPAELQRWGCVQWGTADHNVEDRWRLAADGWGANVGDLCGIRQLIEICRSQHTNHFLYFLLHTFARLQIAQEKASHSL